MRHKSWVIGLRMEESKIVFFFSTFRPTMSHQQPLETWVHSIFHRVQEISFHRTTIIHHSIPVLSIPPARFNHHRGEPLHSCRPKREQYVRCTYTIKTKQRSIDLSVFFSSFILLFCNVDDGVIGRGSRPSRRFESFLPSFRVMYSSFSVPFSSHLYWIYPVYPLFVSIYMFSSLCVFLLLPRL